MPLFDAYTIQEGFDLSPQPLEPYIAGGATPDGAVALRSGDTVIDRAGDDVVAEQR